MRKSHAPGVTRKKRARGPPSSAPPLEAGFRVCGALFVSLPCIVRLEGPSAPRPCCVRTGISRRFCPRQPTRPKVRASQKGMTKDPCARGAPRSAGLQSVCNGTPRRAELSLSEGSRAVRLKNRGRSRALHSGRATIPGASVVPRPRRRVTDYAGRPVQVIRARSTRTEQRTR